MSIDREVKEIRRDLDVVALAAQGGFKFHAWKVYRISKRAIYRTVVAVKDAVSSVYSCVLIILLYVRILRK